MLIGIVILIVCAGMSVWGFSDLCSADSPWDGQLTPAW